MELHCPDMSLAPGRLRIKSSNLGVIWNGNGIALGSGGRLVQDGQYGTICTDTRKLRPGEWYVALQGPNFNGHEFILSAGEKKCAGVVVRDVRNVPDGWDKGIVLVPNTLAALQGLGRYVRSHFDGPVVGITGSYGKTTARAMTALAMGAIGHVHQTPGNLNNHIGVPLSLTCIPPGTAACVFELGMSNAGEVSILADICDPTIRVILNVGPAHLSNFESLDDIARAKGEIFTGAKPTDLCVINSDDTFVNKLPLPRSARKVRFGRADQSDIQLVGARSVNGGKGVAATIRVKSRKHELELRLNSPGKYLALNACAALAVCLGLGLDLDDCVSRLAGYEPVGMRMKIEEIEWQTEGQSKLQWGPKFGIVTVLNDCYNANPVSVASALDMLREMQTEGRRIAVLGDMLELGKDSEAYHREVIEDCMKPGMDAVFLIGSEFKKASKSWRCLSNCNLLAVDQLSELSGAVGDFLKPSDVVLVKGSRKLRMESLVEAIRERSKHRGEN